MRKISYYEISIGLSTGKLTSVRTNSTSVTFLLEHLQGTNNTNIPALFDYTVTIVVYNIEGMSSQPISKSLGMKVYT